MLFSTLKHLCHSPHAALRSGHFVLISHFFACLHVLISSSSLLIDFVSRFSSLFHLRVALSLLDFCFKRIPILSSSNLSCVLRMCDTLSSKLLCSARVNVCKIRQVRLHYVLHLHVLQHHMFHSSKSSLGCPCFCRLTVNMIDENYFMSHCLQKMFRHYFWATPVVRAFNSASAELKRTVCCVRDHAVSVAFPHCTTPPLVLVPRCCLACPIAVCVHVHELRKCSDFDQALCGVPFKYLTIRFRFISSLSVGHVMFLAVSFTLYMTSARFWHMYNNFPTTVVYIARLSPSSSTSDSVVGVVFTLGVITGFTFLNREHLSRIGCTSAFSRSLCPRRKICHPSSPFFL